MSFLDRFHTSRDSNSSREIGDGTGRTASKNLSLVKPFALAAGALTLGTALYSSFYIVDPTDMANVRRMGTVLYDQPVGPGPHMKIPFFDTVDRAQVSLRTLHIPAFKVNTVDNQQVTLDLNFNYTVPKSKVNHLLYEVGKAGSADIDENIIPIAMDRARGVFNKQNTTTVSLNGDTIQAEVTAAVFKAVTEQFGITPHSLQFAQIGYSPAFIASNEDAVKQKNAAIAEQNKKVGEQAKADQMVITAKGKADSAIEDARGQSQSTLLTAQANKTKQELEGQGQKSRLTSEMAAFGGNPELYIKYLAAQAQLKWDGVQPQVLSNGGGSSMPVVVPVPAPKAPKAP